ncbi:MAG: type IV pili twitching motility protein PilT, partial [Elusimicrobia bacterium]|nr:type IV pili twitching motility protein PilT [Elusimicrobiota bacterium]
MQTFNQSLADLVTKKKVALKVAAELSSDPVELEKLIAQKQGQPVIRPRVV